MMYYILLGVFVVIGIMAFIASTKPDDWTVQRQETIPGAPAKVFAYLDDPRKFLEWSPWSKLDPAMKVACGGPASGAGANFTWEGNSKVGAGKMTIMESRPNDRVRCQLDFYKPMKCTNEQDFELKPEGSRTLVTWTISGKAPFYFKLILVFASADRMMGDNLESGLANLKAVVAGQKDGSR